MEEIACLQEKIDMLMALIKRQASDYKKAADSHSFAEATRLSKAVRITSVRIRIATDNLTSAIVLNHAELEKDENKKRSKDQPAG